MRCCQVGDRSISSLKLPRKSYSRGFKWEHLKKKGVIPSMQSKHWLTSLPLSLSSSILSPLLSCQMYNFCSSKRSWDTASMMRNISKITLQGFHVYFLLATCPSSCPLAAPYFWWGEETPWELPSPKCLLVGAGLASFQKTKVAPTLWTDAIDEAKFRWGRNATNLHTVSVIPFQIATSLILPPR